ncbi:26S proteasome non-ATPase regulatory subunit [Thraustotheca clavata]|uniref:26S proteasome non-ATPase regulatory subunit n=1 Tax=Thraustotheca clavata TaxID=74557 RepID=A0A1W0A385_9STRA|nr:26S proteasome non-ATPase regulatory subunit [Thraustotheca clavata]
MDVLEREASKLRSLVENGTSVQEATALLRNLKIGLTQLPSLPPSTIENAQANRERKVARDVLESAAILSIQQEDMAAFERNITQLNVYYHSYGTQLPASQLQYPLIGTHLLHLLVENRMAEFHGELEMLPASGRADPNIAFAMQLEQYLMEGSYNKVLEARKNEPNPYFKYFMAQLLQTVRDAIAECAEVAYPSLDLVDAAKMMMFASPQELVAYINAKKPQWIIKDTTVWFHAPQKHLGAVDIPSMRLVGETLSYATELDRIV